MLQRNWTVPEVAGLTGLNMLRVFREVEKYRDEMAGEPYIETPIDYEMIPDTQCRGTPVN